MKFSVVMHTCREDNEKLPAPVLYMMVNAMLGQDYKGEFELIIVDLLWERRHQQFLEYLSTINPGFQVLHIPDRPSPFKDRKLLRIAGPKNTGAICASGTHVIFTDDCQLIPSRALSLLSEAAYKGFGATMCYEKRRWGGQGGQDISCGMDKRWQNLGAPPGSMNIVPAKSIGYLGGTMSMLPMETIEAVNGFDEMFDGSRQLEDGDMVLRLAAHGQKMVYENRAVVVEYECHGYGDVVDPRPIKCNAAYGYHVWGRGRVRANELTGDALLEAIRLMIWPNCIRLKNNTVCINYGDPCTKTGDNPPLLYAVYTDPRLVFNIKQIRDNIRAGTVTKEQILGI